MTTAPFTDAQVANIRAWQECDWVHPLTCRNRGDGTHHETKDLGVLRVEKRGLTCPDCAFVQTWVPDMCALPLPPDPFASLRVE